MLETLVGKTKMKRYAAFTLVELTMVIAMMSIIAAIAMPRMSGANVNYRLKSAANRIVLDFELAKKQAQAISQDVVITFDTTSHTYRISNLPSLNDPTKEYFVELNHFPYNSKIRSVTSDDNSAVIKINGLGMINQNAKIILVVGNTARTVIFNADSNSVTEVSGS